MTPLDLLAPGVQRNNDNYDNWTYSTRLGYDITDNLAVNLTGRYINAKHGLPGSELVNFFPPSPEVLQETQRNHQLFTRGEVVWSLFDNRFKNFFGVNYSNQWTSIIIPTRTVSHHSGRSRHRRRMSGRGPRSIGGAR